MRRLAFVALAACGHRAPEPAPRLEANTLRPDAQPVVEPPTSTSVASLPRDAWPCELDENVGNGEVEYRYTYDGPEACRIPVPLAASGIVGCPTSQTVSRSGRPIEDSTTGFQYDEDGRLFAATGKLAADYEWHGDDVTAIVTPFGRELVGIEGLAVTVRRDTEEVAYRRIGIEDGRVTSELWFADTITFEITSAWDGGRLQSITHEGGVRAQTLTARYDCA